MQSPIKYYGGKTYMTDIIKDNFPSVRKEGLGRKKYLYNRIWKEGQRYLDALSQH